MVFETFGKEGFMQRLSTLEFAGNLYKLLME